MYSHPSLQSPSSDSPASFDSDSSGSSSSRDFHAAFIPPHYGSPSRTHPHQFANPIGSSYSRSSSYPPSTISSHSSHYPLTLNPTELDTSNEAVDRFLRNKWSIPPDQPVDLSIIADPLDGSRPQQTLQQLVELAIISSPSRKLSLQEIYAVLIERFTWFRENSKSEHWKVSSLGSVYQITDPVQGSIRHMLSLQGIFHNTARSITEPGKGGHWTLDVITQPNRTKRPRKRRGAKNSRGGGDDDSEGYGSRRASPNDEDGDEEDNHISRLRPPQSGSSRGYSTHRSPPMNDHAFHAHPSQPVNYHTPMSSFAPSSYPPFGHAHGSSMPDLPRDFPKVESETPPLSPVHPPYNLGSYDPTLPPMSSSMPASHWQEGSYGLARYGGPRHGHRTGDFDY